VSEDLLGGLRPPRISSVYCIGMSRDRIVIVFSGDSAIRPLGTPAERSSYGPERSSPIVNEVTARRVPDWQGLSITVEVANRRSGRTQTGRRDGNAVRRTPLPQQTFQLIDASRSGQAPFLSRFRKIGPSIVLHSTFAVAQPEDSGRASDLMLAKQQVRELGSA